MSLHTLVDKNRLHHLLLVTSPTRSLEAPENSDKELTRVWWWDIPRHLWITPGLLPLCSKLLADSFSQVTAITHG